MSDSIPYRPLPKEMNERQIQDGLCAYLRKNGLLFIRNRMDKKAGIREGWPDVTVIHCGRAWLCELKTPTGKLSSKQKGVIAELRASGTPVMVARSVESALRSLMTWLGVANAGGPPERGEAPSVSDVTKSEAVKGVSSLFIASFGGKDCVFNGDHRPGTLARIVRLATPSDLINLPRR